MTEPAANAEVEEIEAQLKKLKAERKKLLEARRLALPPAVERGRDIEAAPAH